MLEAEDEPLETLTIGEAEIPLILGNLLPAEGARQMLLVTHIGSLPASSVMPLAPLAFARLGLFILRRNGSLATR